MNKRESPEAIHDRAAEWVARVDRADGDPATLAELRAWLSGDERRRGAFFRVQAVWAMLDRASVLRRGHQDDQRVEVDSRAGLSRRRMLWGSGAIAASFAVLAMGIGFLTQPSEHIETATGEIRRVPLSDGSFAAVNTQTKLSVTLKPEVRQVALVEGEAWFQVAKDRTRPFIVEAGDVRVKAIGTAFSVRRTESGADIQVTEGVVEVWSIGGEANARRVGAGARTSVNDKMGAVQVVQANIEIDRALAWRDGQLIFDGDTVAEAATEFNRYNRTKIEVSDPALGREKMIGRFRTNEPEAFVRAAADILGARAEVGTDKIILSRN